MTAPHRSHRQRPTGPRPARHARTPQPPHQRPRPTTADVLPDHAHGDAGPVQPGVPQRRRRPGFPAGVSYIDFLTPAMLAVSTVMAGTNAGVAAAIDHTNGLHDRFATLPCRADCPASPARSTRRCSHSPVAPPGRRRLRARVPFPRQPARRDRALVVLGRAWRRDERAVRPHRRPGAPARRRAVRRDDDHDAVHVRLRRLRAAGDHAGWMRTMAALQPRRPRHRRPTRPCRSAPRPSAKRRSPSRAATALGLLASLRSIRSSHRREMINVPRPTAHCKSLRRQAKACSSSCGGSLQLDEAPTRCRAASAPRTGTTRHPSWCLRAARPSTAVPIGAPRRGASVNGRRVVLTWNGLSSGGVILFRGASG